MVRFLVSHGFKLVVELEGVVAVVQDVRAVPYDAAAREDSAILSGGDCSHVVDKPVTPRYQHSEVSQVYMIVKLRVTSRYQCKLHVTS